MAISAKQVAARAGVSLGTVSHVLNGNAAARISTATQERVRRAAEELGYRPNRMAQSLRKRRTETVGLLISGLRNPFFVELLEAAETVAAEYGYQSLIDAGPSVRGTFGGHSKLAEGWPVDGVLMWAMATEGISEYLGRDADGLPVVYLGEAPEGVTADCVTFDFFEGGRLATEHLVERGRRRIAYVAPYPFGDRKVREPRYDGYLAVCAAAGLEARMLLTDAEETREAGAHIGAQVAAMPPGERPDALFCHNDMLAIGAAYGLRAAGVDVPGEVAVVGFDGVEEGRFLHTGPLTTVRTDPDPLCKRAMEILARRMSGDTVGAPEKVILPPRMFVGGTS